MAAGEPMDGATRQPVGRWASSAMTFSTSLLMITPGRTRDPLGDRHRRTSRPIRVPLARRRCVAGGHSGGTVAVQLDQCIAAQSWYLSVRRPLCLAFELR